jgi:hypothetical protein
MDRASLLSFETPRKGAAPQDEVRFVTASARRWSGACMRVPLSLNPSYPDFSSPGIDLSQLFHVANARAIRFQLRYIGLL